MYLAHVAALILAASFAPTPAIARSPTSEWLVMTCFLTGEKPQGTNKICYYDCAGTPAAITIIATQLCPQSISG